MNHLNISRPLVKLINCVITVEIQLAVSLKYCTHLTLGSRKIHIVCVGL